MSFKETDSILPVAFGNELERGIVENSSGIFDEPYNMAEYLQALIPADMSLRHGFVRNGGFVYVGGAADGTDFFKTNIETATPECRSPRELVTYMRAADHLMRLIASTYAQSMSAYVPDVTVRMHHRVVDWRGNRKGCHDNFGLPKDTLDGLQAADNTLPPAFVWHLATRSFVTGAGFVRRGKTHFAQKIGGLSDVTGYGFKGTMYRTDKTNGTPRVEVRCSDPNISDWAAWMRIGSTAMMLAMLQTPEADKLSIPDIYLDSTAIGRAIEMNSMSLDPDGQLVRRRGEPLQHAIDFQKRLAVFGLDTLPDYIEDPHSEYFKLAKELLEYCEDMQAVLDGKKELALLADRADWAAKLVRVQKFIDRGRRRGERRQMGDFSSLARDLRYDVHEIHAQDGEVLDPVIGDGFRMRERGDFRLTIHEAEVKKAYKSPPQTRAQLRSKLLANYRTNHAEWQTVTILDGKKEIKVDLPDVTQLSLTGHHLDLLDQVKQIPK